MSELLNRRHIGMILLLGVIGQAAGLLACINTRYSREEERQITSDLAKLIMGQFAHHGDHFFEAELEKTAAEIKRDPENVEARNDHAVAHLKLQAYDRAEKELLAIEETNPGRYRTHANLGVLYKKMGRHEDAARHVRRSLEIQPEGHLGLGDYYLRMIGWMADRKQVEDAARLANSRLPEDRRRRRPRIPPPTTNFLGIAYGTNVSMVATNPLVRHEYLETLIKADRSFSDTYLLLGDVLAHERRMELAYRAYYKANHLEHPARSIAKDRLQNIHREWRETADDSDELIVLPMHQLHAQFESEFRAAELWVDEFESVETDLLSQGISADFNLVKEELKSRGYPEPKFIFAGVVKGTAVTDGASDRPLMGAAAVAIGILCTVMIGAIVLLRRFWQHFRQSNARMANP